jgi:hypothetical protein
VSGMSSPVALGLRAPVPHCVIVIDIARVIGEKAVTEVAVDVRDVVTERPVDNGIERFKLPLKPLEEDPPFVRRR